MQIGFKTGPRTWEEGKKIVEEDGARMCELWFRVDRAAEYANMFEWLAKREVAIGLHYWGLVVGSMKPNLAAAREDVRAETIAQIKQSLEIAKEIGAVYVNVHPGSRLVEKIYFDKHEQELAPEMQDEEEDQTEQYLQASVQEVQAYAEQLGVLLTVETLPAREAKEYELRRDVYDPGNASLNMLARVAESGVSLANDITHTASWFAMQSLTAAKRWQGIYDFTQRIAANTRLLHLNTMGEPFNGTDSHDGLLAEDFARGVFPNREQVLQFLALFADRPDIYAVPEPRENMQENYRALVQLAKEAIPSNR